MDDPHASKVVVGGDFNSSVGDLLGRERNEAADPFRLGRTNDAETYLMNWCLRNYLKWTNSFFRHCYRGTWKHTVTGAWHEIDGFLVKKGGQKKMGEGHKEFTSENRRVRPPTERDDV